MSLKGFISIILILAGMGLIILGFTLLGTTLPDNEYYLDITVSCIIFLLWCSNCYSSLSGSSDESQSRYAQLGIFWTSTWIYGIAAILLMLCAHFFKWSFNVAVVLQASLALALCAMLLFGAFSKEQAKDVYNYEQALRADIEQMRTSMRRISQIAQFNTNISPRMRYQIEQLNEDMRYLSPVNTRTGQQIAYEFVKYANELEGPVQRASGDDLNEALMRLRMIFDEYKNSYSR